MRVRVYEREHDNFMNSFFFFGPMSQWIALGKALSTVNLLENYITNNQFPSYFQKNILLPELPDLTEKEASVLISRASNILKR